MYDALQLNRGIETTFLSIETPYAFKDRFFGSNGRKDGMKDLLDVLGKWKDAVYIPPKQEQAFQRKIVHLNSHMFSLFCCFSHTDFSVNVFIEGGAFVFKGADTAFAYYDAAAGTHLEVSKAVAKALEIAL